MVLTSNKIRLKSIIILYRIIESNLTLKNLPHSFWSIIFSKVDLKDSVIILNYKFKFKLLYYV